VFLKIWWTRRWGITDQFYPLLCFNGGEERCILGLVGKPEGKRPLGRPRRRWEDNIKMDLQEVGCGGIDWIDLA
jgi:hypothetical protein